MWEARTTPEHILYHAALDEERSRLVETAQSQARLMEAVARFNEVYSLDYPEGSRAATIVQIKDAHERYLGFGETGEFTLARRVGDDIVFDLSHRHFDMDKPQPVPFDSNFAGPCPANRVQRSDAEPVHAQAQEPSQIADVSARKIEGVSILLVEDDSAVLESTVIFLELADHRVTSAATVRAALLRVEANRHNLQFITTDYTLGRNETGIQLIERIRETMGHNLPAIIIAGHTIPDLHVEAGSCGCQLLYKPFKGEQLLHFIDKLLDTRRGVS